MALTPASLLRSFLLPAGMMLLQCNSWGTFWQETSAISAGGCKSAIPCGPRYAYIANYGSNDVSMFSLDKNTGALTSLGNVASLSTATRHIFAHPTGKYVYTVTKTGGKVNHHVVTQSSGTLSAATALTTLTNPEAVAVHPTGKFAYVVGAGGNVNVYLVNASDGTLSYSSATATGTTCNWIRIHPNGNYAYVVDNAGAQIYSYTIDTNTGALTANGGPVAVGGSDPRAVEIHKTGNFLYVTVYNANNVRKFQIDSGTGLLSSPVDLGVAIPATSIYLHPSGDFAYVTADATSTNIKILSVNQTTGAVAVAGTLSNGANFANRINVEPGGNFAYTTSWAGVYAVYSVDQTTGLLTTISQDNLTGGTNPNMITTFAVP